MVHSTLTLFFNLSFALIPIAASAANDNPTITVITSGLRPINTFGVDSAMIKVLDLDEVGMIEEQLSRDLPLNEEEAAVIARQRINTIGQATLNKKLKDAYSAVLTAMAFGINRYPAIIFDNEYVIYGVTDVSTALEKYYTFRGTEIN